MDIDKDWRVVVASAKVCAVFEAIRALSVTDCGRFLEVFDEVRRRSRMTPGTENLFGKMRGRFDEAAARRADRTLGEAAIAAIVPMTDDELVRFVGLFNEIFDRPGRSTRWSITRREG